MAQPSHKVKEHDAHDSELQILKSQQCYNCDCVAFSHCGNDQATCGTPVCHLAYLDLPYQTVVRVCDWKFNLEDDFEV